MINSVNTFVHSYSLFNNNNNNTTLFVWKLRKCSREPVAPLRWSPLGPLCTMASHGCLVCVVGALGRFLRCKGVNGSDENG